MQNNITAQLNIRHTNEGIVVKIKVIPGSSRSEFIDIVEGELKFKLNSPPIEGKANNECILLLSKLLKIPKSKLKIISGEKAKSKSVLIKGNKALLEEQLNNIVK